MHKSTVFVTTMAALLGCGVPMETLDSTSSKSPTPSVAQVGDDGVPGAYYFNPGPPPPPPPPPPGGGDDDPNIELSERGLFFGQVCPGDDSTRTLTARNTGGATLSLSGLPLSGDEFSLDSPPGLPARIRPGRSLNLHLRFSPGSDNLLPFDGTLRVVSNDPDHPNISVPLSGLSLPATLTLSPRQIAFGTLDDGETRTRRLTLTNSSSCAGRISRARVTGNLSSAVSVTSLPSRVDPGESDGVNVILTCSGEDDNLDATLRVLDRAGRSLGSVHLTGTCAGN